MVVVLTGPPCQALSDVPATIAQAFDPMQLGNTEQAVGIRGEVTTPLHVVVASEPTTQEPYSGALPVNHSTKDGRPQVIHRFGGESGTCSWRGRLREQDETLHAGRLLPQPHRGPRAVTVPAVGRPEKGVRSYPLHKTEPSSEELWRAYVAAKHLVELLEVAGLEEEAATVKRIRHDLWGRIW